MAGGRAGPVVSGTRTGAAGVCWVRFFGSDRAEWSRNWGLGLSLARAVGWGRGGGLYFGIYADVAGMVLEAPIGCF